MVEELAGAEKQQNSLLALVPVWGPLFIRRSTLHTGEEKRKLSVLSVGLTIAVLAFVWSLHSSPEERVARLHVQIKGSLRLLGDLLEQYRERHGAYPDGTTWERLSHRADPRFVDPWGRPYLYEPSERDFTLRTLGKDGLEGGEGEEADVALSVSTKSEANEKAPARRSPRH